MEMKMTSEEFRALLEKLDGNSSKTLIEKNATYSENHNGDCLHNFRAGAEIMGGTPAQAAWGYMTKHLVALRDMIDRDDFSDLDNLLEKCQDINNYIRFIWCIGNERNKLLTHGNAKCSDDSASPRFPIEKFWFRKETAERVVEYLRAKIIENGYATVLDFFEASEFKISNEDKKFLNFKWTAEAEFVINVADNVCWITVARRQ